jgi:hypothetical protein
VFGISVNDGIPIGHWFVEKRGDIVDDAWLSGAE